MPADKVPKHGLLHLVFRDKRDFTDLTCMWTREDQSVWCGCPVHTLDTPLLKANLRYRNGYILQPAMAMDRAYVRLQLEPQEDLPRLLVRLPMCFVGTGHKEDRWHTVPANLPPLSDADVFEDDVYWGKEDWITPAAAQPMPHEPAGDGGNTPEVPTTTEQPPTGDEGNTPEVPSEEEDVDYPAGPKWEFFAGPTGVGKHYSQRHRSTQKSNVKFGKAREDIEAYAKSVEPFIDLSDEAYFVPFSDMTNFVQTMTQLGCDKQAHFRFHLAIQKEM